MIWNPFRKLQKVEEKRSMPTVKFDPKRVTPDVQKVIADRILNSKIIPDEHKPQATVVAIEATQRGRDLHHLCSFLIGLHIDKSDA
ncbi:hypothetical protein [Gluconobacter aidae]|uniref:Uncharacterized protein n=1 Tax=Gluconobacter aidae TaxID=2662454 RepID=A0A7X1STG2_9PROT|nr:hypothetical protein [Gluconobacter aidae]MQS00156.1 hypothetical protein [Gluconobacter aidae]